MPALSNKTRIKSESDRLEKSTKAANIVYVSVVVLPRASLKSLRLTKSSAAGRRNG